MNEREQERQILGRKSDCDTRECEVSISFSFKASTSAVLKTAGCACKHVCVTAREIVCVRVCDYVCVECMCVHDMWVRVFCCVYLYVCVWCAPNLCTSVPAKMRVVVSGALINFLLHSVKIK
jgi:hypothetical protein